MTNGPVAQYSERFRSHWFSLGQPDRSAQRKILPRRLYCKAIRKRSRARAAYIASHRQCHGCIAEAFGVSEDLLNQTFKFKKGHWLLISHDATGLEAVPVPIASPNANDRLAEWLMRRYAR